MGDYQKRRFMLQQFCLQRIEYKLTSDWCLQICSSSIKELNGIVTIYEMYLRRAYFQTLDITAVRSG